MVGWWMDLSGKRVLKSGKWAFNRLEKLLSKLKIEKKRDHKMNPNIN